ncbi:MAG TPA: hypothetical protein VM686_29540 [Polyangiaceae bacterium]|nr:hypothetical protein [Polyangiaceae bacterium]
MRAQLLIALLLIACDRSGNDAPPPQATGGMDAGSNRYDQARAIESCQNACASYTAACTGDCADDCDAATRLSSAEACPAEFYAYYDCVAATAEADFDCDAGDTVDDNPAADCAATWLAYSQCRRTRGEDCVLLTRNASVCTSQNADTPDWATCKLNVDPPSGCEPLDATDFCCAAQ